MYSLALTTYLWSKSDRNLSEMTCIDQPVSYLSNQNGYNTRKMCGEPLFFLYWLTYGEQLNAMS